MNSTTDTESQTQQHIVPDKAPKLRYRAMSFIKMSPSDKLNLLWRTLTRCCNSIPRIFLIFFVAGIIAVTTFSLVEGQNWLDSLYWMSTTSTTTGYGDIAPKKELGKLLTSLFMHAWYILGAIFLANLVANVLYDPHIWSDAEQRAMSAAMRRVEVRQMVTDEHVRVIMRSLGLQAQMLPELEFDKEGNPTNISVEKLPTLALLPPVINDSSYADA